MTTFTIKTKNDAIVSIEVTQEQVSAFIDSEVKKLQDKLNAYKAMDFPEAGQAAVDSLKARLNKLEADNKLETSYNYEDLKKRASGNSFTGYLTELGIEKSLHGSATRALALGKATLAGLKLAKIDDKDILKTAAKNAIGGKNAVWREAVLDWLMNED
jgi:hypothetical protein